MFEYKALPDEAEEILRVVSAPPRLVAHLTLVHDVSTRLVAEIHDVFPDVTFKDDDIFFGAATHDIGKVLYPLELVEPGKLHEAAGRKMMRELGVSEKRARFAFSHGNWQDNPEVQFEDMLVALADNCWKGKRNPELEGQIIDALTLATGKEQWEIFASLDGVLEMLSADADHRLAWQDQFPVT